MRRNKQVGGGRSSSRRLSGHPCVPRSNIASLVPSVSLPSPLVAVSKQAAGRLGSCVSSDEGKQAGGGVVSRSSLSHFVLDLWLLGLYI